MDAEEYQRSIGMKPVTSEKPAAAVERALGFGEWVALLAMCAADTSPAGRTGCCDDCSVQDCWVATS